MYSIQEYLFGGATLSDKIAIFCEMPSSKFFETGIIDSDNLIQQKPSEVVEQISPTQFNFYFAEYGNPSGEISTTPMQATLNVARHVQVEVKNTTGKLPVLASAYPERLLSEQRKVEMYYKSVLLNMKTTALRGIETALENTMLCHNSDVAYTKVATAEYKDGSSTATNINLGTRQHTIDLKTVTSANIGDKATALYAELLKFDNVDLILDKSSVPYLLSYYKQYNEYFKLFSYLKKYMETFQGTVHGDGSLVSTNSFTFDSIRFVRTNNTEYKSTTDVSGVFFKRSQYMFSVPVFESPIVDMAGYSIDKYTYSQLAADMAKTDPIGAQAMFNVGESQIKSQMQLGKQKHFGGGILQLIFEKIATGTNASSRGQMMTMRGLATAVPTWAPLTYDAPVEVIMTLANIPALAQETMSDNDQRTINESKIKTMGQVVDNLAPNGEAKFSYPNGETEEIKKKNQKTIY